MPIKQDKTPDEPVKDESGKKDYTPVGYPGREKTPDEKVQDGKSQKDYTPTRYTMRDQPHDEESRYGEEPLRETPFFSSGPSRAEYEAQQADEKEEKEKPLEPPTLLSLEERIDELEARIASVETREPVRGEQETPPVDHAAQHKLRARRRAVREKQATEKAMTPGERAKAAKATEEKDKK